MDVTILTKPGCVRCLAAKPKMSILGVPYVEELATLGRLTMAGLTEFDIPGFIIDGKGYTYPEAMAKLKRQVTQ